MYFLHACSWVCAVGETFQHDILILIVVRHARDIVPFRCAQALGFVDGTQASNADGGVISGAESGVAAALAALIAEGKEHEA